MESEKRVKTEKWVMWDEWLMGKDGAIDERGTNRGNQREHENRLIVDGG